MTLVTVKSRFEAVEYKWCVACNKTSQRRMIHLFFKTVSRLGDGVFWYMLMAAFAIHSSQGRVAAAYMLVTGLVGVALYKVLKQNLVRERPFIAYQDIVCGTPPLDRYSFPSGHTLQAVLMTTLALAFFPMLAYLLVPFTICVALSRVILGLHYPTDVVVGALIGWSLAKLALSLG